MFGMYLDDGFECNVAIMVSRDRIRECIGSYAMALGAQVVPAQNQHEGLEEQFFSLASICEHLSVRTINRHAFSVPTNDLPRGGLACCAEPSQTCSTKGT